MEGAKPHDWHWSSPSHLPSLEIPGTIWNQIIIMRICQTTDECVTLVLCCILWEPSVTSTPIFKLTLNRLSCHEGNTMPYLWTSLCVGVTCHGLLLQLSKWNFNYLSCRTLSEAHFPHSRVLVDATFLELQGILSRREGKLDGGGMVLEQNSCAFWMYRVSQVACSMLSAYVHRDA